MKAFGKHAWSWLLVASLFLSATATASSLRDFNGKEHSLSEYTGKGQWLVVMIWASDCHICNAEVGNYNRFHESHRERDASVLGISIDGYENKADALKFINRHSVKFPNLIVDAAAIARMFTDLTGSYFVGTPTFLVYSPSGELLGQQAGAVPTELIEEFIRTETAAAGSATR